MRFRVPSCTRHVRWALLVLFACCFGKGLEQAAQGQAIQVQDPKTLGVGELPAERIPLGVPGDYKPTIARLKSGVLVIVAFHTIGGLAQEYTIWFRSEDGGRSWSKRKRVSMLGREPYLSTLSNGTLFSTSMRFKRSLDSRNPDAYTSSYLYRSTDEGESWQATNISWKDLPGVAENSRVETSRNVLELADGTAVRLAMAGGGRGPHFLWRSKDQGQTWDKPLTAEFRGAKKNCLWETVLWLAPSGDLLTLIRVHQNEWPLLPGAKERPPRKTDDDEHMIVYRSADGGRTWELDKPLGSYYGEHYPSVLRLADGRLLLTFTVRALRPPLGVRAVLGTQQHDGFQFDFGHDRLMLETKTPVGLVSGGGYGNTVQLDDGTLVTPYSYRTASGNVGLHLEVVRWRLPAAEASK